jgi:hypothetical protein
MPDETQPDPYCAVCERRLLPGERPIDFVTRDGATVLVCELCKPRAEAAGWLRPDEYEAMRGSAPTRDRRRPRAGALGGLLSRLGAPAEGPQDVGAPASAQPAQAREMTPVPEEELANDPLAPLTAEAQPLPAETGIADALYAFNHSDHRRTVAGLSRTLGPPRATALEIKNGGGLPAIRLTIAWELTWYQWEVGPSGRGHEVRESGKGETIDQLRDADRAWNLLVGTDGTLQQKVAPPPAAAAE